MQLAVPLAGAAVGYVASGGVALWVQVGWFAGSMLYSYLNPPEGTSGPRLSDLSATSSNYGQVIPRTYGTVMVAGQYIWAPDYEEVEREVGGKGGGKTPEATLWDYYADFACLACEGPVDLIRKIWFDDTLVYDMTTGNDGWVLAKNLNLTIHLGGWDQTPDPVIEAVEGVGNVPAYNGQAYITVARLPLKKYGNRLPVVRMEVVKNSAGAQSQLAFSEGDGVATWSAAEDVMITDGGDIFYKWNTNTNEIIDQSPAYSGLAGSYSTWDVDQDTGILFSWRFFPDGSHYQPMFLNTVEGWGEFFGSHYQDDVDGCEQDYFMAPHNIVVLKEAVAYCGGTAGNNGLWLWPKNLDCAGLVKYAESNTVSFAQDDSDGNIWYTIQAEDKIKIIPKAGGTILEFNTSTVFSANTPTQLRWHPPTDSMLIQTTTGIFRATVDISASTLTEEASSASGSMFYQESKAWYYENNLWVEGDKLHLKEFDVQTLTQQREITHTLFNGSRDIASKELYDPRSNAVWAGALSTGSYYKVLLDRAPPGTQSLDVVVSSLSEGVLVPARKDVTDLASEIVRGFVLTRPEAIRESIRRLMISHRFGSVDSDGKVKYKMLGKDSVVTIPQTDLNARHSGTAHSEPFLNTLTNEADYPKRVEVTALAREREYEPNTLGAGRNITASRGVQKISLVEVLTPDEIAQTADIALNVPRREDTQYDFNLPYKYAKYEPLDVVTVDYGSVEYVMRLTEHDHDSQGVFSLKGVSTKKALFSSVAVGASVAYSSSTLPNTTYTKAWLADISLLDNADNYPGFYTAFTADNFVGAALFEALDTAGTGVKEVAAGSNQATAGYVVSALSSTPSSTTTATTWDWENTLTVRAVNGTLQSDSEINVLNGANALAIVPAGEIVQFVTASVVASSTYRLSQLLRGRRGTEWAMSEHQATGGNFVLLEYNPVYNAPTDIAANGLERVYRAVTYGLDLYDSTPLTFTNTNERLKPFSPVRASGTWDGTDMTLGAVRRSRAIVEPEYKYTPVFESSESYELDITDASGSVTRTQSLSSLLYSYTSAQMVTDYGYRPSIVYGVFYQISDEVGRGRGLSFNTGDLFGALPLYTDFSEYASATNLGGDDWTFQVASTTFIAVDDGAATGGRKVQLVCPTNVSRHYTWDKAPQRADAEILVHGYYNDGDDQLGNSGFVRAQGGVGTFQQYAFSIDQNADFRIWHYDDNGADTDLTPGSAVATGLTQDDEYWVRLQIQGNVLRAQYSSVTIDGSDPVWDYEITDTTLTGAGYVGLTGRGRSVAPETYEYDEFAVAFDGNRATFS